jgi:cytochrome P450
MTINSLILGLIAHPRVVKKAHEELDRVVGASRLPTFKDEKNLPYIRAIVKEVISQIVVLRSRFFVGDQL